MSRLRYACVVSRAFFELVLYDVACTVLGFHWLLRLLPLPAGSPPLARSSEHMVTAALQLATCLYWKRVLCLQRSFCRVRLLRPRGVAARLIIGYRPVPFFSHAWVKADGRGHQRLAYYRQRLHTLYTA